MGRTSREEIERGLTPQTASHDRMVEAGIRQEADHASARELASSAVEPLLQLGRRL